MNRDDPAPATGSERERFLAAPDMVYFVVAFTPDGRQIGVTGAHVDKVRAAELAKAEASVDHTTAYVVGVNLFYLREVEP